MIHKRPSYLALHFAICILQFAICNFPSPAFAAPPAVAADGSRFRADLIGADAQWRLTFSIDGRRKTVAAADLVRWGELPEQGRAGGVVLADGSLLAADIVSADKDALAIDSDLFGVKKLPLESLAGVVFHPPADRLARDKLFDRLAGAEGQSDRLLLDNGDELAGLIEGIDNNTLRLKTDVGSVDVKTDRATALIFDPSLKRKPRAKKRRFAFGRD